MLPILIQLVQGCVRGTALWPALQAVLGLRMPAKQSLAQRNMQPVADLLRQHLVYQALLTGPLPGQRLCCCAVEGGLGEGH